MTSSFNLLPFLEGWQYKEHIIPRTVTRGADPIQLASVEYGWLMSLTAVTTDALLEVTVESQVPTLDVHTISATPYSYYVLGRWVPDPMGWLQLYRRPNPANTVGSYMITLISAGFHGTAFPHTPVTRIRAYLDSASTQTSASVTLSAFTVAVTDQKAFLKSWKHLYASQGGRS